MDPELEQIAWYVAAFVFVLALIAILSWVLRNLRSGGNGASGGLLRRGDRRLGVVEAASVDGRRRLILVRRDDVEHLIMTGGPVDVLLENGIQRGQPAERPHESRFDDGRVIIAHDDELRAADTHDKI